jgi:hypothetical protein
LAEGKTSKQTFLILDLISLGSFLKSLRKLGLKKISI